jgi:glycosyltransferase involved in cell wall biosynthesis
MKIIIISEYNKFVSVGGTENYVDGLINGLVTDGNEVVFITQGTQSLLIIEDVYVNSSGVFYELVILPKMDYSPSQIQGKMVSGTWNEIENVIFNKNPDVIHIHTLSTFFNFSHFARLVEVYKNKIFLTLHVAGHFCVQGDMIKYQKLPCDGRIGYQCVKCVFHKNIKSGVTNLLNGYFLDKLNYIKFINQHGIHVVCVSEWQKNQMLVNGLRHELVTVIRPFLDFDKIKLGKVKSHVGSSSKRFTIGYLGRFSREKGSELLIKIAKWISNRDNLELILGCPILEDKSMLDLVQNSKNIYFRNDIRDDNKDDFFNSIDLLIIPSFCFETGPIVLLEAINYSTFVLGPNVGGVLEFAATYPSLVFTHAWNNFDSFIIKLNEIIQNNELNLIALKDKLTVSSKNDAVASHLFSYSSKK